MPSLLLCNDGSEVTEELAYGRCVRRRLCGRNSDGTSAISLSPADAVLVALLGGEEHPLPSVDFFAVLVEEDYLLDGPATAEGPGRVFNCVLQGARNRLLDDPGRGPHVVKARVHSLLASTRSVRYERWGSFCREEIISAGSTQGLGGRKAFVDVSYVGSALAMPPGMVDPIGGVAGRTLSPTHARGH